MSYFESFFCNFKQSCLVSTAIALAALQYGCTNDIQGEYEDPSKVEIVNEDWNDTDFRKTAQALVAGLKDKPFLKLYKAQHNGKNPVLVVDDVMNKTPEHIDTRKLTDIISDELINSQDFDFVAADMRQKVIEEMNYQENSGMVNPATKAQKQKQTGINFFMRGNIAGERPSNKSVTVITYTVFLQLVDLETSRIVWSGRHEIKKRFKRSSFGL